jgi:hypothetical protein
MSQGVEESYHRGVICLFCGKSTRLPAHAERRRSASPSESTFRASIIRCHLCGREALYLPEEMVDLQEMRNSPNLRARAVGLP